MSSVHPHLSHPKYRPDIDGLRAVAVISVVIFHAFPSALAGGFIGVDIFFVISGFLISTIIFQNLDRGTFSFGEFYVRRIRRIFPGLLLVLAASYAFGWFALLADEFMQLGKHVAGGAGFVANLVLWSEAGYFDKSAESKPLLHLWSLGIEEQFYIVWPLLLWMAWKRKFNLLTLTVLIALVSFALNVHGVRKDPVETFYSPQRRFWELLCGSLLAWLTLYRQASLAGLRTRLDGWLAAVLYREPREHDGRTLAAVLSVLGLLLLGYGFWRISAASHFPGSWALVPVLGAVLLIAAGPQAWLNRKVLAHPVVVWFGLISFPLYLWHWPLLSFTRIVRGGDPPFAARTIAVVVSVLLAWLTYRFVERPVRLGPHGAAKAGAMALLMALMGGVGFATFQAQGIDSRFSPEARYLTQRVDFDWKNQVRYNVCHLQEPVDLKQNESCYEKTRPLIALWGDSHAASLYPGFRKLQAEHPLGILQLTQAGCPPILDVEKFLFYVKCNEVNQRILQDLQAARPEVVIMHAAYLHLDYPMSKEALYARFAASLQQVKARLPQSRLVVMGPVPRWKDSPQKTAFLYWRQVLDKTGKVPAMLPAAQWKDVDENLARIAQDHGVEYVSVLQMLCKGAECLSRVGEAPEDFVAIDDAHLSAHGAAYLVKKMEARLFGP
ncbi:acyltransferase family protein [Azohydromonas australica]|uniref:acyltransferase family protein n=1 Tax=Azohydromonas australica TaxID=364039 RepID=UPI00042A026D|nr:acyltransferase family protein [Azohydromonas australica]